MDSLRNNFEINLTIREAKSSGRVPTTIHTEIGGTRVNISSTVPLVAEVYLESNPRKLEKNKLEFESHSNYKKESHENGSTRTKRSVSFPQTSSTDKSSTRTKRSLNFPEPSFPDNSFNRTKRSLYYKYKSKIFPTVTAVDHPESSSDNEKPKNEGGITYPYNFEKEYQKAKAREWKFDREQKKKEEKMVKDYYKKHEKMLEGWKKLNERQNSLWEKERERERARKEEYKRQREENDKRLHAEYLKSLEKKKSQMQSQSVQNDKSKRQ